MSAASIEAAADPLPIRILGVLQREGQDLFWFRLANGSTVMLSFEQLATRQALVGMFGGEAWLRRNFPGAFVVVASREGGGRRVPTGVDFVAAAQHLAQLCIDAEVAALAAAELPRRWWGRLTDLFSACLVAGLWRFHV